MIEALLIEALMLWNIPIEVIQNRNSIRILNDNLIHNSQNSNNNSQTTSWNNELISCVYDTDSHAEDWQWKAHYQEVIQNHDS